MSFTPRQRVHRARALRREQTPAEVRLWGYLRDRRLQDIKFVRQETIGPFIADFVCREARLVVEIDGSTHSTNEEQAYDRRREAYFRKEGYRTVRIQNEDVYRRLNDVLATILAALEDML